MNCEMRWFSQLLW